MKPKTLLDVCEFIIDCEHKTAPLTASGYPSIRTPNVGRGRLLLDGVNRVDEATYQLWTKRAVPRPGDLIIAREAPVGNVALITKRQQVCLGQRTVLVRPDRGEIDERYLTYLLLSNRIQEAFHSTTIGVTVPHLNMKDIRELVLPPLPNRDAQVRIGTILSSYDDLIENNTRRIAILEEMARRIFEEWFVDFRAPGCQALPMVGSPFGPVPQGWEMKTLRQLANEIRDPADPRSIDPDTPYVGLEHIPRRSTTFGDWGKAGQVGSLKLKFQTGDILFGKIRPYFHKCAVAPLEGVASSDAIIIRPKQGVRGLVTSLASSDAFVAHAVKTSNGTKMPRADWKVLREYPIAIPPADLAQHFELTIWPMIELGVNLAAQNRNLRAQRDLLLPKLISGEIDVSAASASLQEAAE